MSELTLASLEALIPDASKPCIVVGTCPHCRAKAKLMDAVPQLITLARTLEQERDAWKRGEAAQRVERLKAEDVLRDKLRASEAANAGLREAGQAVVSQLMRCGDLAHFPELGAALDNLRKALTDPPSPGGEAMGKLATLTTEKVLPLLTQLALDEEWNVEIDALEALAGELRAALATGER